MSRDYRKLKTFQLSDELVIAIYKLTESFPRSELFGLTSQLRRAAVSVPTNIVEGSHRSTLPDYLHFLDIAFGSLAEVGYLLDVSFRLGYNKDQDVEGLNEKYDKCIRHLKSLIKSHRGISKR